MTAINLTKEQWIRMASLENGASSIFPGLPSAGLVDQSAIITEQQAEIVRLQARLLSAAARINGVRDALADIVPAVIMCVRHAQKALEGEI